MKKPKNLPDSAPESGEKKQASTTHELVGELSLSSKKETKLEFAIPVAPGVDSAYFDWCGDTIWDTGLEYTALERTLLPGIYRNNIWESVSTMEEDTCMISITYYDQNLYTVAILDNGDWDQEEYPASRYPDEMKNLLAQVAEKWDVSFPLIDEDCKDSRIIINKEQLDEFLADLKIDSTEVFKNKSEKAVDTTESGFMKTEDGYEIKNIFPTDFADYWTFTKEHISLENADNGDDIYLSCLMQNIEWKNITNAGLEKLIESMNLIYLPENKIQVKIQPTLKNDFGWMTVKMWRTEHNEYSNLIKFLQNNLRKQYTIAKKWNIDMPLVSWCKLESYLPHSITLDQSKLQDFMKDLGIDEKTVVLPK